MADPSARIAENVQAVRERIAAAARGCGRAPDEIVLVAVTKYASIDQTLAVINAGCLDLGESRPQELWRKKTEITDTRVRWHLIGHLQSNKVRRTVQHRPFYIHSVDSLRLLAAIDEESKWIGKSRVLL